MTVVRMWVDMDGQSNSAESTNRREMVLVEVNLCFNLARNLIMIMS